MRFHHFAIEVKDLNKSQLFYETMLGFNVNDSMVLGGEEIVFLVLDGFNLELLTKKSDASIDESVHLCFEVESLNDIIQKMSKIQLEPIEGPEIFENGWSNVFYKGPDNEILEFLQT